MLAVDFNMLGSTCFLYAFWVGGKFWSKIVMRDRQTRQDNFIFHVINILSPGSGPISFPHNEMGGCLQDNVLSLATQKQSETQSSYQTTKTIKKSIY